MEPVDATYLIAGACRFYGWKFDDAWNMPARRFFALLKAKRKIECIEAIDRLDEILVASDNVSMKWYETLRDRHMSQLRAIDKKEIPKAAPVVFTDEQIKETQVVVLSLFRQRKRYMGYGG